MANLRDPLTIEKAARDSWDHLNRTNPLRLWAAVEATTPEVLKKHTDMVQAYFVHDFDTQRALMSQTNGRMGAADLEDDAAKFHTKLKVYLQTWAKNH